MIRPLLIVLLLSAATAFAQDARVYTNADLDRPLTRGRFAPAAAARLLEPYQFVPMRDWQAGPQIVILGSPTAGPFGEFAPFAPSRRLDGSLWSDPPWQAITYLPYDFSRGREFRHSRVDRRSTPTPGHRRTTRPTRSR